MRLTLNIVAGCVLACESCGSLLAAPPACVTGTLASYVALGAGGCTSGTLVFANFAYSASAAGGAPTISAHQITVTPMLIVPQTTAFSFSASWSVSHPAHSQDSIIKYTAVLPCGATQPAELDLTLGSAQVGGIVGSVTVRESTNVGNLTVFDRCTEVCQSKTSDRLQIEPVSVVLVTEHVSLVGGTGGASLNAFTSAVNLCIPCV
jgi:hypothetical protein